MPINTTPGEIRAFDAARLFNGFSVLSLEMEFDVELEVFAIVEDIRFSDIFEFEVLDLY
jgi:hypothetical protein